MDRRGFFKMLGSAAAVTAAGLLVPPDLLELLAPEKTIILPPTGGWVATGESSLLTAAYIVNEALKVLEGDLLFMRNANWANWNMLEKEGEAGYVSIAKPF